MKTHIKWFAIHTWVCCLLASLVLAAPAMAEKPGELKIHAKQPLLLMPQFLDKNLSPYQHWPKQGQLTILHLWATWCAPCLEELPALDKIAAQYDGKKVIFLPVALDKELPKVENFYEKYSIKTLPLYFDPTVKIFRTLEVYSLPGTLFINADGREIARIEGPTDWNSPALREFIASHLPD